MHKNLKIMGLLMPVLTVAVWIIWVFVITPAMRNQILDFASKFVDNKINLDKKRRSSSRIH